MLIDGEVDAALIGDKFPDPRFKTLVPDAEAANKKWAETHGGVPVNHMVIVRETDRQRAPRRGGGNVPGVQGGARSSTPSAPKGALDPYRFGVEANRQALERIIDYSVKQQMIPRKISRRRTVRRRHAQARRLTATMTGEETMRCAVPIDRGRLLLIAAAVSASAQGAQATSPTGR